MLNVSQLYEAGSCPIGVNMLLKMLFACTGNFVRLTFLPYKVVYKLLVSLRAIGY